MFKVNENKKVIIEVKSKKKKNKIKNKIKKKCETQSIIIKRLLFVGLSWEELVQNEIGMRWR